MLPGENQGMLKYSETMFSLLLLLLSASSTFAASCNSDDDCSDNNGPNFCNPVGNYKYCYNCNSCAQYSCTSSKCNSDPPATTCSNKNVGPCEAGKYCKVTSYSSSCSNCASGRFTSCESSATSCSYCSGTTSGYPNSVCSAPSKSTGCETGDNMPCQHTNATIPNLDSCYCGYRRCTSSTGLLCDKLTKTCSKKSYQLVAPFNVSALLVSLLVFGLLLAVTWYLCLRFAPGQHHYIIYKGSKSSKSHGRKTIITPTTSTSTTPTTPTTPHNNKPHPSKVRTLSKEQIKQRVERRAQAKRGSVHLDDDFDSESNSSNTSMTKDERKMPTKPALKIPTEEQIQQRQEKLRQSKRGSVHF